MAGRLIGAQDLRNRLAAIQQVFPEVGGAWADLAVDMMQKKIYSPGGHLRSTIAGRYSDRSASVWADYRVTFIDKGRKAITPPYRHVKVLKIGGEYYGRTTATNLPGGRSRPFFAPRAGVKAVRRRPFITSSARQARKDTPYANELLRLWRMSGGHSEKYVLGGKGAAKRRAAYRRAHAR